MGVATVPTGDQTGADVTRVLVVLVVSVIVTLVVAAILGAGGGQ